MLLSIILIVMIMIIHILLIIIVFLHFVGGGFKLIATLFPKGYGRQHCRNTDNLQQPIG